LFTNNRVIDVITQQYNVSAKFWLPFVLHKTKGKCYYL